jgi:hypothetical protein
MHLKIIMLASLIGTLTLGCSEKLNRSDSINEVLNLSGRWTGNGSDNTGPGKLTWDMDQDGNKIKGSSIFKDPNSGITGNGTILGMVSDSTLNFTMEIPRGGLPSPYTDCEITISGTATNITENYIQGTYSGRNSCTGELRNGRINMNK